jgi:ferredoxin--NADP+ reductase
MAIIKETVLRVEHYTPDLFHFTTTRDPSIRFRDGEFVMMGLEVDGKPLMRAYSVASPNHQETLEFYSIKVQDGPLTSRLQHIREGDEVLVNTKAVGTLVLDNLKPGRNLYFLATGTGIAPFLSLTRGVDTYENYDNVIVAWGARTVSELPFIDQIQGLNNDEVYSNITEGKLKLYPTVTREPYVNEGRVTHALFEGRISEQLELDGLDPKHDRIMICGSIPFNKDLTTWLEEKGFTEGNANYQGEYVVERAFVG